LDGPAPGSEFLLDVRNLTVTFAASLSVIRKSKIRAVDNVSLRVIKGESLGIVGESGSGKTTLARAIVKLVRPTAGSIEFSGSDIYRQRGKDAKDYRRRVQMVFQDPYESLNPRSTARQAVEEPIAIHRLIEGKEERRKKVFELLSLVGLNPKSVETKYPHELSGGERQRVSLARALSLGPELLIADEPVSMLDVSVRIGVINLMLDLKRMFNLTCVFITHDLAVARYFCDRIGVMYRGKVVEVANTELLLRRPLHPYTKLLIDSVPGHFAAEADGKESSVQEVGAEITGCVFNPRCAYAQDLCRLKEPELLEIEPGRFVACHFPLV
jgi:oligopeptide/dipeptide ABC transporter ATP-binding protein